ncbi:MAG TPA: F0F1 ATP synthase subunit A [Stellaceae bacterium]|nr:F0F1 ATP synthase subunit A [Stellaceae bacterium]
MASQLNPLKQFEIKPLIELPHIGGIDFSYTNSALFMTLAVVLATAFIVLSTRRAALVPGRWQSMAEFIYEFIANMIEENAGTEGMQYFPYIFTLFMFVLFGNLLGMVPYAFTYTSHIIVTFAMAAVIFVAVTVIGFKRHGLHFFTLFAPKGVPWVVLFLLVPIELISYFIRPFTLSIRLFANMLAGHAILAVFAGFVAALGIFGIGPLAMDVGLILLEFLVAVLQAYIFTILTCLYLNDAIHLH